MALMSHVRSMKHLQMEQIHQIQKRAEGNIEQTEIGDIFQVVESTNTGENEGKIVFYISQLFIWFSSCCSLLEVEIRMCRVSNI